MKKEKNNIFSCPSIFPKSRKAAIEMSMTTFVTIVLVVIVMVLGIFFIQKIFTSGTNAIDSIDSQVQSEINKLFADEGGKIAVYPTSRQITLKKGDDPKGFAFSVRNDDKEGHEYDYSITADDVSNCGSSMTKKEAENYLLGGMGSFSLGAGNSLDLPRLVKFDIPESAPPCTIIYTLHIMRDDNAKDDDSSADIFITIK
jgi:hypothetical protein